jgi:hypothetical protein
MSDFLLIHSYVVNITVRDFFSPPVFSKCPKERSLLPENILKFNVPGGMIFKALVENMAVRYAQ